MAKIPKNTQFSFWLKAKSSSYKFAFEDYIFVVGSAADLVDTTLEIAAFAAVPTLNRTELVPSVFFFLSVII